MGRPSGLGTNMSSSLGFESGIEVASVGLGLSSGWRRTGAEMKCRANGCGVEQCVVQVLYLRHIPGVLRMARWSGAAIRGCSIVVCSLSLLWAQIDH